MPQWLCLPLTTMFTSKLNREKLKFIGISEYKNKKKFSALNVHGKHFNGHKIRAFVPTAKTQNMNSKGFPKTITKTILIQVFSMSADLLGYFLNLQQYSSDWATAKT